MRIFYDVDTQNDFMNENGALYVPSAEGIKSNLRKLTEYAWNKDGGFKKIPIIGSIDRHFGTPKYKEREKELQRNGGPFPDHCMDKTVGQEKIRETYILTDISVAWWDVKHTSLYIEHNLGSVDKKVIEEALKVMEINSFKTLFPSAVFFEKQNYDIFTNPAIEEFLRLANVDEAVVYGVATDYCVKAAVLGMQKRNIQCYVVEDAIKGVAEESTQKALEEMAEVGAKFVTIEDICMKK